MRQPTPTTGSNPFLCGLIFFIFSEALSPMDWPSVRSPVRSERVSLPPRPFAHPEPRRQGGPFLKLPASPLRPAAPRTCLSLFHAPPFTQSGRMSKKD